MAANESDKTALTEQFKTVFGTTDHPLHTKLQNDLISGRSLGSVLTDLREAETHRARESKQDNANLYIASL